MPRPAKFDRDQILDAALEVLAAGGPADVSVAAIARALGAPSGSIYHRYSSRDLLLASLWLREAERFQQSVLPVLDEPDPRSAAVAVALHTVSWARRHQVEARLLLLHRRQDFFASEWPLEVAQRALILDRNLKAGLGALAKRLWPGGRVDSAVFDLAVTGIALAAVREPLATGRPICASLDRAVAVAVAAVLDNAGAAGHRTTRA